MQIYRMQMDLLLHPPPRFYLIFFKLQISIMSMKRLKSNAQVENRRAPHNAQLAASIIQTFVLISLLSLIRVVSVRYDAVAFALGVCLLQLDKWQHTLFQLRASNLSFTTLLRDAALALQTALCAPV